MRALGLGSDDRSHSPTELPALSRSEIEEQRFSLASQADLRAGRGESALIRILRSGIEPRMPLGAAPLAEEKIALREE